MKKLLMMIMAAGWMSCTVDDPMEPDPVQQPNENNTVTLGIKLGGGDWQQASNGNEGLRMAEQPIHYGYHVLEVRESGTVLTASGVTTDIGEVEITFEKEKEYQIILSSVSFEDKYDVSTARIFDVREEVSRWPAHRTHSAGESRSNTRESGDPFATAVRDVGFQETTITHRRFESDKFIGLEQLVIDEETDVLEIDMYRYSAGLTLEVENLREGKVELILEPNSLGEHQQGTSVWFTFNPESTSTYDLRPYQEINRFNESYFHEILDDPDGNEKEYAVLGYYILEDEEGNEVSSKRILNTSLILRRNYNLTYVIDMNDFNLDAGNGGEQQGNGPRLNYVDEELIEGETVRLN